MEHLPRRLLPALALAACVAACGGASSPVSPSSSLPSSPYSETSFREAARITAEAATEVWRSAHAGWYERDVKSLVDSAFAQQGGGAAFAHIVAAGPHGLELHYAGDDGRLEDGELLLIDIGATSNQHCADVSRTYPVSGRFTARQAELYQLVLDAQAVAASSHVGTDSLNSIGAAVRQFLRASPLRAKDASGVEATLDTFFTHGIGHYVGREVHGGDTGFSAAAALQAGQVIALEPGVYIASEGIAVRIEDTYLAAAQGLACLSCAAPKEIHAVER